MYIQHDIKSIYGGYEPDLCDIDVIDYYKDRHALDIESCQDFITGIIEAVYVEKDGKKLEHCLEELCYQFGMKFDPTQMKATKKGSLLESYTKYQQELIKNIKVS